MIFNIRHTIALLSIMLLSACATNSGFIPIGNGKYEISGTSATALSSGYGEQTNLLNMANKFCEDQGKEMVLITSSNTSGKPGSAVSYNGYNNSQGDFLGFRTSRQSASNYFAGRPGVKASADIVFHCSSVSHTHIPKN